MTYPWPPLPVLDPLEAARLLGVGLQAAHDRLEAYRLRILTDPTRLRKREVDAWVREFQAAIAAYQAEAAAQVEAFIRLHLEPRYQAGVAAAADGVLTWTAAHQAAMVSLVTDTFEDFLARSVAAGETAVEFAEKVRAAARGTVPLAATGATTARQAGEAFARELLDTYRLDTVTYANGAKVPVSAYAEMAARTKSAVAYNAGTLNACVEAGTSWVEVFDGSDCGWTSHEDTDKANGTVRHVNEAMSYALAHPNCGRAFGPRPDVRTRQDARGAAPSTTAAQRADQAAFELERAAASVRRSRARARDLRVARRAARTQQ